MSEAADDRGTKLRDGFWQTPPSRPPGLDLERAGSAFAGQAGEVCELIDVRIEGVRPFTLVATYLSRLLVAEISGVKASLSKAIERLRGGESIKGAYVPAVVTDIAKPTAIEACLRNGIAVLDMRGTCVIRTSGIYIYVVGADPVEVPAKNRIYAGGSSLIVRHLLTTVAFQPSETAKTVQVIARHVGLSYSHAHGIMMRLERDGFLFRASSRRGFRLLDPVALLRAWRDSKERTARVLQGFHLASTSRGALAEGARRLQQATGYAPLFTLGSALTDEEGFATAACHGVYCRGDLSGIAECFELGTEKPYNFYALVPHDDVWTDRGGLLERDPSRIGVSEPAGLVRVSLPQLVVDFATLPVEDVEKSDTLLLSYSKLVKSVRST